MPNNFIRKTFLYSDKTRQGIVSNLEKDIDNNDHLLEVEMDRT